MRRAVHAGAIARRAREAAEYKPTEIGGLIATPVPHGDDWLEVIRLPAAVPEPLSAGSETVIGRPLAWCTPIPRAYLGPELEPARSRLGLVALMCAIALFASSCWSGTIAEPRQVSFPQTPSAGKNSDVPRRYPSRIHTLDCHAAMAQLAAWTEAETSNLSECIDADDYWECAFVERQRLWYELAAYAYRTVDECAPETWKGITP